MAGLHNFIPGIADAEARFQRSQIEGFLGVEPDVWPGLPVAPFTPRMFLELDYAGNEVLGERADPDPIHVEQFLWRAAPDFARDDRRARLERLYVLGQAEYVQVVARCHAYLVRAWEPAPLVIRRKGAKGPRSAGTWVSSLVDAVAHEYHWPEADILDLPFRRLWQYANRILERADKDYVQACPEALALRDRWLLEVNRN